MQNKDLLERYARYYDVLGKLGGYPLSETPTVDVLVENKSQIQSAYKEIKSLQFKGNLIDYFCCISTRYIFYEWEKEFPIAQANQQMIVFPGSKTVSALASFSVSNEFFRPAVVALIAFINICRKNQTDMRNMLRYFQKCPEFMLDTHAYELFSNTFDKERLKQDIEEVKENTIIGGELFISLINICVKEFYFYRVIAFLRYTEIVMERLKDSIVRENVWDLLVGSLLPMELPETKLEFSEIKYKMDDIIKNIKESQ